MRRNEENWNNFWQIAILYGFWDSKKIIFTIQDILNEKLKLC